VLPPPPIWTLDLPNQQVSTKIHNHGETNFQSYKEEGKGEEDEKQRCPQHYPQDYPQLWWQL
jgi:hypothetical protein